MKLKCIGGPNDGEYRETQNRRYGDLIVIQQFEPTIVCFDPNAIPEPTKLNYARYKVEKISWWLQDGNRKEWFFLLYENLTIREIFDRLFT